VALCISLEECELKVTRATAIEQLVLVQKLDRSSDEESTINGQPGNWENHCSRGTYVTNSEHEPDSDVTSEKKQVTEKNRIIRVLQYGGNLSPIHVVSGAMSRMHAWCQGFLAVPM